MGPRGRGGFYQRFGVQEHRIVDPFEETIEVIDLTSGASSHEDPARSKVLDGFTLAWKQGFEG
jgi:Uma2 family endonuclease